MTCGRRSFVAGLGLLPFVAACSFVPGATPSPTPSPEPTEVVSPSDVRQLVDAFNGFGFRLATALQGRRLANQVISPLSAASALGLVYNGSAGGSQRELASVLGLGEVPLDTMNRAISVLRGRLTSADPSVHFDVANSLWADRDVRFKPDFLTRARRYFAADATSLDFKDPSSVNAVNQWVGQHTEGKITHVVERLNNAALLVVNALYFKGAWTEPFDPKRTENGPFHSVSGALSTASFMTRFGYFPYYRGPRFQSLGMNYGKGQHQMIVVLPDPGVALSDVTSTFGNSGWKDVVENLRSHSGSVKLPRFSLNTDRDLADPLKSLGASAPFDSRQADFSGLSDTKTFISAIDHAVLIQVDEAGTVAAAATTARQGATAPAPSPNPFDFVADRPFMFAVRDQGSGAISFLGMLASL